MIIDTSGNPFFTARYDAFGDAISGAGLWYGYTGKYERYTDGSTGTTQMGVREYDPSLGRFISQDPLQGTPTDPQQRNRYSYVGNDPLTRYDLSGMFTVTVDEVWAFGEGALTGAAACLAGAPGCAVVAVGATAAVIGYEGYQIYEEGGNPAERYDRYYEDNKCLMPPADAGINWGPGGYAPGLAAELGGVIIYDAKYPPSRELARKLGVPYPQLRKAAERLKGKVGRGGKGKVKIDEDGEVYDAETGEDLGNVYQEDLD